MIMYITPLQKDLCKHPFYYLFQGMQHHVLNDHNMWAYIYYFIYLNEIKENDYTSVDLYVSKMVRFVKMLFRQLNCYLIPENFQLIIP